MWRYAVTLLTLGLVRPEKPLDTILSTFEKTRNELADFLDKNAAHYSKVQTALQAIEREHQRAEQFKAWVDQAFERPSTQDTQ